MISITNLVGRLKLITPFGEGWVLFFMNPEIIANQHDKLQLRVLAPYRAQEPSIFINLPTSHSVTTVESLHQILEDHESDLDESSSSCAKVIPTI